MQSFRGVTDGLRSSTEGTNLTPYLGLRSRLSQVWINRWTILLILVLIRTLIAIGSIDDNLQSAREKALSACIAAEEAGSTMASMPHYMSRGVNQLTARGIERAVNGLMSMVGLTIQGVEEIVVFVIGLITNTYLCLITFAVTGSLKAALDLIAKVNDFLKSNVGKIGDNLSEGVRGFQDSLNGFLDKISGLPLIGDSISEKPSIDLGDQIKDLRELTIPGNLSEDIAKLKDKLPDFAEVKKHTESVIRLPFEKLRGLVNTAMGNYTFDSQAFPVAQKKALTFCSDNDDINSFFDSLVKIESVARKVFIAILIIAAIAVCVPIVLAEIRRWRRIQKQAAEIDSRGLGGLDAMYIASQTYTSRFIVKLANRTSSLRTQTIIRWVIAYATSPRALFVLILAVAGLLSCLCQYILLKALEKKVPEVTAAFGQFSAKIVDSLEQASNEWATEANAVIAKENDSINKELFGWVKTSTQAVNDTLNEFVDKSTEVIDAAFGKTILRDPIQEIFDCLIGLKVQGIERGLTWVHDHAHITFPLLKNDTFTIENLSDEGEASFLASANNTSDQLSRAIFSVTRKLASGIRTEALISTGVLLIWIFIVLVAVVRGFMLYSQHEKHNRGGASTPGPYPGMASPAQFAGGVNNPSPSFPGPYGVTMVGNVEEAYAPSTSEKFNSYGKNGLPPMYTASAAASVSLAPDPSSSPTAPVDGGRKTVQLVEDLSDHSSFSFHSRTGMARDLTGPNRTM